MCVQLSPTCQTVYKLTIFFTVRTSPKNSVGSRFHGDSWITTFTCFGLQTSRFFPENFTYRNANLAFVFKEMVLFCFNGPNFQEI